MIELCSELERSWFVAALSSAITPRPQSVRLFGQPMVLVRNAGVVWALEDRCAHRGAPLSGGRLNSRGLVCPYHGWTYGADGGCRDIPGCSTGTAIPKVQIPAYAVLERDGLIWVSAQHVRPLPERITVLDPARQRFLWQTLWRAPVLEAQENFLDALHTHFVHPGLVRSGGERHEVRATLKITGDGFVVDYEGRTTQSGLLFRLFESERISERAHFSALGVAQLEYRYADGSSIWITLCFSPRDNNSTHIFASLHVAGRWAPRWLVRWGVWPFLRRVAAQDREILENSKRQREFFGERLPLVAPQDLVRPYLQAAWDNRLETLPSETKRVLHL